MKDTLKKITAITVICLITAQTVSTAPVKNVENTGIILCSDDSSHARPVNI